MKKQGKTIAVAVCFLNAGIFLFVDDTGSSISGFIGWLGFGLCLLK